MMHKSQYKVIQGEVKRRSIIVKDGRTKALKILYTIV